jgi:uncharacterized damage-inducible protein DinB
MTHADLETLLDYHYWARDRVLEASALLTAEEYTRGLGSSFKSIRDTLVHTYSAEWAWHSRWVGVSPREHLSTDLFPDVPALGTAWSALEGRMRDYLAEAGAAGEPGITRVISYSNLQGVPGSSVFWHMLQHVINHATYHRGQVSTMLRQLGAKPSRSQDLIAFYRERAAG